MSLNMSSFDHSTRSAAGCVEIHPARGRSLFLLMVGLLLLGLSMTKRLDHDEHQFIASGVLWARRGLLPYRDYPYFHMPYMVFVYGLLFKLSDHLLLVARVFTVL